MAFDTTGGDYPVPASAFQGLAPSSSSYGWGDFASGLMQTANGYLSRRMDIDYASAVAGRTPAAGYMPEASVPVATVGGMNIGGLLPLLIGGVAIVLVVRALRG